VTRWCETSRCGASSGTEIQVIARCDACQPEGLEAAMRRAGRYLHAGAHGIFIPGVPTVAGLVEVGKRFGGAHLMIARWTRDVAAASRATRWGSAKVVPGLLLRAWCIASGRPEDLGGPR
jgi:2-methylisocitrate lyase-like PEP mutase family enzyme